MGSIDPALEGKVAIVTGAAGGIGGASARELASHGAKVLVVDVREEAVAQVAEELRADGHDVAHHAADVSSDEGVAGYVAAALERFGTIDLFHNNAGFAGPLHPVQEYPLATFDHLMSVNVRGVFLGMHHVLPVLLEKGTGAIVNTASICSWNGFANQAAYTASKHAVVGLTKSAAMEVATTEIRVNAVCPGVIETEFVKQIERVFAEPDDPTEGHGMFMSSIPAGRYGHPDEIATVVRFLLSDEARYVQGAAWTADGGMQAKG
jgi:NAD(P)-dependent dehydrogenase (short-subunit alcohol dehydrogenase family)